MTAKKEYQFQDQFEIKIGTNLVKSRERRAYSAAARCDRARSSRRNPRKKLRRRMRRLPEIEEEIKGGFPILVADRPYLA